MTILKTITPDFSVAAQISLDDVSAAARAGFKTIICNRPDGEDIGQLSAQSIAEACHLAGLNFTHIPVAGGMSQGQIDATVAAIEAANGPVLAYCRSGTRSTNLGALAYATMGGDVDRFLKGAASAGYDLSGLASILVGLKRS